MHKSLLILFLALLPIAIRAQLETSADWKRQVYDREYTFGISGHTMGYGANFRYLKFDGAFHKKGLEIELSKLRHPKEVTSTANRSYSNARGYVFDRENSFFSLRGGYIYENILFDKTDQGTVSISLILSGGLSLGLVKPIYVQILANENSNTGPIVAERYNHQKHTGSTILGEANFFKGIGETKLHPGAFVKVGSNFNYQLLERKVTSLEAGVIYDFFYKEVPIFYEDPNGEDINLQGFLQFYIAFNFGYRKN